MIQDQIFRGIAYAEQEDLSNKSNRDKVLLMEILDLSPASHQLMVSASVMRDAIELRSLLLLTRKSGQVLPALPP